MLVSYFAQGEIPRGHVHLGYLFILHWHDVLCQSAGICTFPCTQRAAWKQVVAVLPAHNYIHWTTYVSQYVWSSLFLITANFSYWRSPFEL